MYLFMTILKELFSTVCVHNQSKVRVRVRVHSSCNVFPLKIFASEDFRLQDHDTASVIMQQSKKLKVELFSVFYMARKSKKLNTSVISQIFLHNCAHS